VLDPSLRQHRAGGPTDFGGSLVMAPAGPQRLLMGLPGVRGPRRGCANGGPYLVPCGLVELDQGTPEDVGHCAAAIARSAWLVASSRSLKALRGTWPARRSSTPPPPNQRLFRALW
jgi:hypothetical protein